MKKLTNDEVLDLISRARAVNKEHIFIRYGQALFNCLYDTNPELANFVRGTNADPYHARESDERIDNFFKAIT